MNSYRTDRGNDFYSGSYRSDHYGNRSSKYSDHQQQSQSQRRKKKKKSKTHDLSREQKVDLLFNHLQSKGETQYDKSQLETFFQEGLHLHSHILNSWGEVCAAYNPDVKDSRNLDALLNPSISYVPKEMKENNQSANHYPKDSYQYGDCNVDNPSLPLNDYINQSQSQTLSPTMPHHSSGVPPALLSSMTRTRPTSYNSYADFSIPPPKIPQPSLKEHFNTISKYPVHPQAPSPFSNRAGYNLRQVLLDTDVQHAGNKDLYNYSSSRTPTRHQTLRNEIPKCHGFSSKCHGFSSKETMEGDANQRQICATRKDDLDPWNYFFGINMNLKKEFPMDAIKMTDDEVWFERHICSVLKQESDFFGPYHLKLYEQTLNAKCNSCINGLGDIGLVDQKL